MDIVKGAGLDVQEKFDRVVRFSCNHIRGEYITETVIGGRSTYGKAFIF